MNDLMFQRRGFEGRDHVFNFLTKVLLILIIASCIMTFLTIGSVLLKAVWVIYVSISETLQVTLFMINKKIDLNI